MDGGSGGGGVNVVGAVTYGGGLPTSSFSHSEHSSSSSNNSSSNSSETVPPAAATSSRSRAVALLSSLDVAAKSNGQAGLIDGAFATARQQLLLVAPHADDASMQMQMPTLRLAESNVPLVFVVLTTSGAFESSAGAVAKELALIDALLPVGSTAARLVVNYDVEAEGSGVGASLSGSGSAGGSAQVVELLKANAELAFQENQFLQSIAAPNDAVFPASCTHSAIADSCAGRRPQDASLQYSPLGRDRPRYPPLSLSNGGS